MALRVVNFKNGNAFRNPSAGWTACLCGAEMRILAFIEEDRVIGRILRHLGLLPDASRGPPLQEPVYEPIYNDLPAVEEEDVVYQPF
jgi:hypothetical protein